MATTSSGARLPWQPVPEPDEDQASEETIEPRPGDFTSRLARAQRKATDTGLAEDDPDVTWLRDNNGGYQGPLTWTGA